MNSKLKKVPLTKGDIKYLKKYRKQILIVMITFFIGTYIVTFSDGLMRNYKQPFLEPLWILVPIFTFSYFLFIIPIQIHLWRNFKFETEGEIERIVTTANKAKLYVRKAMILRYGVVTKYVMLVNGKYYPVPDNNKVILKVGRTIKIGFIKIPKKILNINIIWPKYNCALH